MMFHGQGFSRNRCNVVAVVSRENDNQIDGAPPPPPLQPKYPFPDLSSSGRLKIQVLNNPTTEEFQVAVNSSATDFVYLQGEQSGDSDEVGPFVLGFTDFSTPDALVALFGSTLPTTVYLELPNGEELAQALYSKGVQYVIYWKNAFTKYAACHFRHALFSVIQSSCSDTWDVFHVAEASFRLYCTSDNTVLPSNSNRKMNYEMGPCLLGDPPKIDVVSPEADELEDENSLESLPSIKIYDEDVTVRFLLCGPPCTLDTSVLGSLVEGLNALLRVEMRGSRLHNRSSAPAPPLQAGTFTRGVVTMRCDISTCSSAHISMLVSGNAQTCFSDQLLENHIKHEVIEKIQLVHSVVNSEETERVFSEPRRSASIACGACVCEVSMQVPTWALQVFRQLAPDVSYRSLVILGVASIQGLSVASFEKDDAERLLFFSGQEINDTSNHDALLSKFPHWLTPPLPTRKRSEPCRESKEIENGGPTSRKINVAALRPLPHTRRHKMIPFSGYSEIGRFDGDNTKGSLPMPPKHGASGGTPVTQRKAFSGSYQRKQIISLNPLPLKKHDCGRAHIQICSEEEFLRDVMQFLLIRGHSRLVPPGGLAEFPDAVLNSKRLDLFNLYREVVSRGGFHVGNGINWKGQVFSKMRNHTLTNRMTGVGNTLKRHYETYLLEYEYAHDDVDGECCLICRSSTAGDWVNCGSCGEWAHFGCDRRPGLGAFKDYAKTDGLEYVCPNCSVSNYRKKTQKTSNGGLLVP
ncbi:PREDICTED: AT-rich interactive domain-containing protein 4-like isoform X2 [Camelina sativa]|uniref:AT-rich interactive domain-containing protein 4-like isoform X2 n=1 Tax=Camelina sativa TaxID=90675 RepID=A0ABM0ZEQ6_CAMSA|nr:PREDICTED: AT-rich interactive domain-containing protein 4-like isoform X2 [Camelina sativa]